MTAIMFTRSLRPQDKLGQNLYIKNTFYYGEELSRDFYLLF